MKSLLTEIRVEFLQVLRNATLLTRWGQSNSHYPVGKTFSSYMMDQWDYPDAVHPEGLVGMHPCVDPLKDIVIPTFKDPLHVRVRSPPLPPSSLRRSCGSVSQPAHKAPSHRRVARRRITVTACVQHSSRRHTMRDRSPAAYSGEKVTNRNVRDFGWEMSSRGRFATPADFPLHDCSPYSHVTNRRES